MAQRLSPEIQVLCYPSSAISQRGSQFFSADNLGELVFPGYGDASAIAGASWADQWQFVSFGAQCRFVRFNKDGTVDFDVQAPKDRGSEEKDVAGFILDGRDAALDSQLEGEDELDGGHTNQTWTPIDGTWKTVLPPAMPRGGEIRTCIVNSDFGDDPTIPCKAFTTGTIPANRSFVLPVLFSAHDPANSDSGFAFQWGTEGSAWSMSGDHGKPWAVFKQVNGVPKSRKILPVNANLHGGAYYIMILRIAGRLVIRINDQYFWVTDYELPTSAAAGADPHARPDLREAWWGEGQIKVSCRNVKARVGFGVYKWSSPGGSVYTGSIVRNLNRNSFLPDDAEFDVRTAGYKWRGVGLTGTATVQSGAVQYTLALTASTDGIDSPFVHLVTVRRLPAHTGPSASPIDIGPAVKRLQIRKANPPTTCGDELEIEVSRNILEDVSASWQNYVKDFNPIHVLMRWKNDDGSHTDYEMPFHGSIHGIGKSSDEVKRWRGTIRGQDALVRLQKPAGVIDYKVPPLDYWFAVAGQTLPGQAIPSNARFWTAQAVREIIRLFLGDTEATNFNGDGNALRFLPTGHPPLIDLTGDLCGWYELASLAGAANGYPVPIPMKGGFLLPPPRGEDSDAWQWVLKLGKDDQAVCYRGWADNDSTAPPSFLYGRPLQLIANRTVRRYTDAVYTAGDLDRLMQAMETGTRPERQYNRVISHSRALTGGLEVLAPALVFFESRLDATDPNSAENSWERTAQLFNDIAILPGAAQSIAQNIISQLTGVTWRWPTITLQKGDAGAQYGDIAHLVLSGATSDPSIGLNNTNWRVETVVHTFTRDEKVDFKTELGLRPLSTSEAAAL